MKRVDFLVEAKAVAPRQGALFIYGEIGNWRFDDSDVSADDVRKKLEALGELDLLDIYIDSPGGSVCQATSICAQLARMKGTRIVAHVDGLAASAASYIAVHAHELAMAKDAWLMIHEPSMWVAGDADALRAAATLADRMGEQYAQAYADKSGLNPEAIRGMMRAETWMDAQEAKALGFCDRVSDMAEDKDAPRSTAALGSMQMVALCGYANMPDAVRGDAQAVQTVRATKGGAETPDAVQMGAFETGIPAQGADTNIVGGNAPREGMTGMDLETLRKEYGELVAQLLEEGAQGERQRLQALDELPALGCGELVTAAKYGPKDVRCTAEVLAVRIVKQRAEADKAQGAQAYGDRRADAAAVAGVGAGANVHKATGASGDRDEQVQSLVKALDGAAH